MDSLSDEGGQKSEQPTNPSSPVNSASFTKTNDVYSVYHTTNEMSDTSFFSQHKFESPPNFELGLQGAPRKISRQASHVPFAYFPSGPEQSGEERQHLIFSITRGQSLTEVENAKLPFFGEEVLPKALTEHETDILDKVYELSFDQAGCRMIQQHLEQQPSPDFVPALIEALTNPSETILPEVMANQFGNYLC